MEIIDAMEAKAKGIGKQIRGRTQVGSVERFYSNISVAAIRLTGALHVGDTIEVESEGYALRQKVGSMQINRRDVSDASSGDSIGVKLSVPVPEGSAVYKLD